MGFLEERDFTNVPTIPEFYKGKSIFITGGSGFMGKVLIEKLLYSCSDLDTIYLLMRSKRGVDCEERLANIYSSVCFDRLRHEKPTIFKTKIVVIPGDIMKSGLGISEQDRTMLINHVNIVFHTAASVRFNDTLKHAVRMNLNGTNEVLELAKNMRNLCAFIHVSTAYSNTHKNLIEEIMYPPHANVKDTLAICENLDEHTLKIITPKYLGELPNTYVFSKQLADHIVYENKGQLPAVIIRPSIVISSYKEPVPGWIENYNGPMGILCACAKGILKTAYCDPNVIHDYMPVDISIRSIIVAAWSRGTKGIEPTDDIPVYNCCSRNVIGMTNMDMNKYGLKNLADVPLGPSLWHYGTVITKSKTLHYVLMILLQLLPAMILDTLLKLLGRPPMLVKIQRRIYIATIALAYYSTQEWIFDNKNLMQLRSCIKDEDLKSFYYDIENVDIHYYYHKSTLGARKYLAKRKDEDITNDRVFYWRMYYLHVVVMCIFWIYVLWWIVSSKYVQNILMNIINFN